MQVLLDCGFCRNSWLPVPGVSVDWQGRFTHSGILLTAYYGVSLLEGFILGAYQSFSRVLYSELMPPGHESEFFSLYEVTDKGMYEVCF